MKVAFLSFEFGEYCTRLASALAQQTDVLLLLPEQQAALYRPTLDKAVCLHAFSHPRLRQPFRQLGLLASLMKQVMKFDPDVLHLQSGHLWFNIALPLLREYPIVLTVHDHQPHPKG